MKRLQERSGSLFCKAAKSWRKVALIKNRLQIKKTDDNI